MRHARAALGITKISTAYMTHPRVDWSDLLMNSMLFSLNTIAHSECSTCHANSSSAISQDQCALAVSTAAVGSRTGTSANVGNCSRCPTTASLLPSLLTQAAIPALTCPALPCPALPNAALPCAGLRCLHCTALHPMLRPLTMPSPHVPSALCLMACDASSMVPRSSWRCPPTALAQLLWQACGTTGAARFGHHACS
jgi:hypothetical protein